jgi:hypothetical protein
MNKNQGHQRRKNHLDARVNLTRRGKYNYSQNTTADAETLTQKKAYGKSGAV